MNFGLLCDDPAAAWVISGFQSATRHRITRAILVSPAVDELIHGLTGVTCSDRWEDLLAAEDLDAVIVGGSTEAIWDGARQIASTGLPLLVFPTISAGPTILYELSLIRDDRQSVLFPIWSHRYDSELRALREQLLHKTVPSLNYVQWEQHLAEGAGRELSNQTINTELFRAADLLQFLFGAADQVTALRTGGTPTGALLQSVVLAGRKFQESTWSIKSADKGSSQLTLQSAQGPRVMEWKAARQNWQLQGSELTTSSHAGQQPFDFLLMDIEQALTQRTGASHWTDVLRAAEIVDASERSLLRRRTIDLNHETLSERAIFKTQMTAIGCGLLLLTLFVMMAYLAIDSLLPWDRRLAKFVLVIFATPMFLYLLVQFLLPLTRTSSAK